LKKGEVERGKKKGGGGRTWLSFIAIGRGRKKRKLPFRKKWKAKRRKGTCFPQSCPIPKEGGGGRERENGIREAKGGKRGPVPFLHVGLVEGKANKKRVVCFGRGELIRIRRKKSRVKTTPQS